MDGCYNCLCGDTAFYKNGVDRRFENLLDINQKISCGITYTPYDAAVSVMTAALIQEAVLSTLEHERDWNYKEHIFMGSRTKKPTWIRKKTFVTSEMIDKELVFKAQDRSLVVISTEVVNILVSYRQLSDFSQESAGVLIGERRVFILLLGRYLSLVVGTLEVVSW